MYGYELWLKIKDNQSCFMVYCQINLPAEKEYLYQSSIAAFVPLLAVEL